METLPFMIYAFSSLFAVIDPLGCIPFFSGLTAHMGHRQQVKVLIRALVAAFGVLMVFTWFGPRFLEFFGITVNAFRIAGGVIFFGIGLDMLQSRPRRWRTGISQAFESDLAVDEDDDDPSITPLAIPLLAGPGSITTVMVLRPIAPGQTPALAVALAVLLVLLVSGGILKGADLVIRRLGQTGLRLIEKLMGLVVTVIAVQLILDGVSAYLGPLLGA